ncbi:MAG: serine/threonine protein kinase with repeat, partial [Planctomycetaceae bacterium]|nr:serine/threonine protein kinase with repeat [Planctomycetaceae bacterium]
MHEKHLILAVLAFESKLINLAQLTEACGFWTTDKSACLTDILQQRGWVDGASLAVLEEQFQSRLEPSQTSSLGTLSGLVEVDFGLNASALQETGGNQSVGTLPRGIPELLESLSNSAASPSSSPDRYTWVSEVGKGGLGQVWLARDNDLVREVALKEIKAEAVSSEAVRRLIKEAQITGQLQHPNIVPVYEVRRGERPFYTMKLVRGKTLAATIKQHHEQRRTGHEDPLSMTRLMSVFVNICDALAYAHSRGIIHRDLKPQNIVLGDFGEAIVLDWGLARRMDGDPDVDTERDHTQISPVSLTDDAHTDATQTGAALGTPAYMSPEQAGGRVDLMDARTDIYGLGAILFEILTGSPPHRKPGFNDAHNSLVSPPQDAPSTNKTFPVNGLFALLTQIRNGPTPHIRELNPGTPIELDAICARAMARDREDRFQSAKDFKEALMEYHIHKKSIELAASASADLESAKNTHLYLEFNRALFGFEEASRQWPENVRAAEGRREAQIAFAQAAFSRGDFDLAESLLDIEIPEQKALRTTVNKAAAERANRHDRIRFLRRFSLAASLSVAIVASTAAIWVNNERLRALLAREDAKVAQIQEAQQRQVAERERLVAIQQTKAAQRERQIADEQTRMAVKERQIADEQTKVAIKERQKAAEQLERADRTTEEARWGRYISSLRLAAIQLDNRSIAFCNQTLQTSRPVGMESDLRGWEWNYLWNQTHSDQLTIQGHTAPVQSVSFSPDGKHLVSGSWDHTIKLWDALTGKKIRTLEGHSGWIRSVSFSHDGLRIVSSSDDKTVKIWDAQTGQEIRTLQGHDAAVQSAAFSPDGSRIVSGSNDQIIKVWNAQTGAEQQALTGHKAAVLSVAFSPDGQWIVSGSDDHTAKIWNVQTAKFTQDFTEHSAPIQSVGFSPDGQRIVSGSRDGLVLVWNANTVAIEQTCAGHTGWIRSVIFTPSGNRIVSASDDKTIMVWDLQTGKEQFTLQGHTDGVACAHVSLDDKRIASGSYDKSIKIWDAQTGLEGLTLSGHQGIVRSVAFGPQTRHVASASS